MKSSKPRSKHNKLSEVPEYFCDPLYMHFYMLYTEQADRSIINISDLPNSYLKISFYSIILNSLCEMYSMESFKMKIVYKQSKIRFLPV